MPFVFGLVWGRIHTNHGVDREDSPIIILDTSLVPDFVLHACYFFITGNPPVLKLPHSTNKSPSYENRGPKSLFVSDPVGTLVSLSPGK